MNKEDFIKQYCKASNIEKDELLKTQVVLPCNCGEDCCQGWAIVNNTEMSIRLHKLNNGKL